MNKNTIGTEFRKLIKQNLIESFTKDADKLREALNVDKSLETMRFDCAAIYNDLKGVSEENYEQASTAVAMLNIPNDKLKNDIYNLCSDNSIDYLVGLMLEFEAEEIQSELANFLYKALKNCEYKELFDFLLELFSSLESELVALEKTEDINESLKKAMIDVSRGVLEEVKIKALTLEAQTVVLG